MNKNLIANNLREIVILLADLNSKPTELELSNRSVFVRA